MFELIRGAVSYLFPGPLRSGVFEPDGTRPALTGRAMSPNDTSGEVARVSQSALRVSGSLRAPGSSLQAPSLRSEAPDLDEPRDAAQEDLLPESARPGEGSGRGFKDLGTRAAPEARPLTSEIRAAPAPPQPREAPLDRSLGASESRLAQVGEPPEPEVASADPETPALWAEDLGVDALPETEREAAPGPEVLPQAVVVGEPIVEQPPPPPPPPPGPNSERPAREAHPDSLCLSVPRPRCPFCHEGIAPGVLQEACKACRAWHHEACWREGRSRCSACRAPAVSQAIQVRVGRGAAEAGLDSNLAMSWTVVTTSALGYSLVQIPLRDVYRLHPDTLGHALTNAWSAIPTVTALSCLFLASALRPGRWRQVLHWVAWGVVALTAILALHAAAFTPIVPWDDGPGW